MRLKYLFPESVLNASIAAIGLALIAPGFACRSVKPYQRKYLNDEAMQVGQRPIEKLSSNAHTYREGASGGGKAKTSGGCGCN